MLVRNVRLHGKHKLANRWDPVVHVVVKHAGDLPVYTVKPEKQDGPQRTLHRDLLLPCGFLFSIDYEPDVAKPAKKRVTRQSLHEEDEECPENYQSSDEDDYGPQISDVSTLTSERFI